MWSLLISIALLVIAYFTYAKIIEKIFCPDNRKTPAYAINDGVDCVPLPTWKTYLIQLLNIAGTGPIFGALMGAIWGPIVFIWIVLGCVLGGAVHDYYSGMISCRNNGESIAELSGRVLGSGVKYVMRVFSILLLILVGAVFITSPAQLLSLLTPNTFSKNFWVIVILIYYFVATLLPIDKLIGKLYPFFGAVLICMTLGIFGGTLIFYGSNIPEITVGNLHPNDVSWFPFMCVTVACGAISGFHSTQSPMMAKCIKKENKGLLVFYGAMISEGIIALAWAAAGVVFYQSTGGLQQALSDMGQSGTVYDISIGMLGMCGGVLAVIGVIACPITSGDTAFRSCRLILSEWAGLSQKSIKNRLKITIPLLTMGGLLTQLNFDVLWRYFGWSNQTLAMLVLVVASVYICKNAKNKWYSLITAIPGAFMVAVTFSYILSAEEGFKLPLEASVFAGILFAILVFITYLILLFKKNKFVKI